MTGIAGLEAKVEERAFGGVAGDDLRRPAVVDGEKFVRGVGRDNVRVPIGRSRIRAGRPVPRDGGLTVSVRRPRANGHGGGEPNHLTPHAPIGPTALTIIFLAHRILPI